MCVVTRLRGRMSVRTLQEERWMVRTVCKGRLQGQKNIPRWGWLTDEVVEVFEIEVAMALKFDCLVCASLD